jgi:hypothetical protein
MGCALLMSIALAACGSSGSSKGRTTGWTSAQKATYLTSCHRIALRDIKGLKVLSKQRDHYCAK